MCPNTAALQCPNFSKPNDTSNLLKMAMQTKIRLVVPNVEVLLALDRFDLFSCIQQLAGKVEIALADVAVAELSGLHDSEAKSRIADFLSSGEVELSFLHTDFSELLAANHLLPSIPLPKAMGSLVVFSLFADPALAASKSTALCLLPDQWFESHVFQPGMLVPVSVSTLVKYCANHSDGQRTPIWEYLL